MTEPTPSAVIPPDSPVVRVAVVAEHLLATVARHLAGGNVAGAQVFARELDRVLGSLLGELEKL